ncbi:hypothetical protein CLU79DRAFT_413630 [Phycomyces nitens]|nr:hypothetical protein CLU79DRAFT_413630 [Phycomyces nitens]
MGCCASRSTDDPHTATKGKPFKRAQLSWVAEEPITRAQLDRQRTAFWETAPSYEGRREIWQALQAACSTPDIHLARSILDAANVTLPTGNPAEGCFDELGNRYEIPLYCLVDPSNLVSEETSTHEDESETAQMITPVPPIIHTATNSSSSLSLSQSIEKTSAPTDTSHPIIIRLSTAKDLHLNIHYQKETVGSLKMRIFEDPEANIAPATHTLRLIYLGRILQDNMTIDCEDAEASQTKLENTFRNPHAVRVGKAGVIQALVAKKDN